MKKNCFALLSLLCLFVACSSNQKSTSYTVTGELADSTSNGKMIYIERVDDRKYIDSTRVEGNKFVFTGQIDTAVCCRIDVTPYEFAAFILESGDIRVYPNMKQRTKPSGTPLNEAYTRLTTEMDSVIHFLDKRMQEFREKYTDEIVFKEKWGEEWKEISKGLTKRCIELYKVHNNDAIGYSLLYSVYMSATDLDTQEAIINTFGPWLKSTRQVQDFMNRIQSIRQTAEGKPFVDIKGRDLEGKDVALSDYVGKGNYVLMDMWASWCSPCKEEIPNLAKLHNQFKDKGLTVVGLFVWDKEEKLKKAVEKEKICWPQIYDKENVARDLYGVKGIPFIVLFAPDGTILKRELRGEVMIKTVTELLTKK